MDKKYDLAASRSDVGLGHAPAGRPIARDPFRIAILGDFTGRASREECESGSALTKRNPVIVDRDNFDDVFRKLSVSVELPVAGRIRFAEIDDFHPDRLYEGVRLFAPLRKRSKRAMSQPARGHRVHHPLLPRLRQQLLWTVCWKAQCGPPRTVTTTS